MIIYEFTTWCTNKLFAINEIEVEEKTKTYIGKHCRINKDEIGKMQSTYGNRMYLLDNNPEPYISAMKEHIASRIKHYEAAALAEKEKLSKWEALKEV